LHAFPCALLNVNGYYDALMEFLRGSVANGFVRRAQFDSLILAPNPDELFLRFAEFRPEKTEKWIPKDMI